MIKIFFFKFEVLKSFHFLISIHKNKINLLKKTKTDVMQIDTNTVIRAWLFFCYSQLIWNLFWIFFFTFSTISSKNTNEIQFAIRNYVYSWKFKNTQNCETNYSLQYFFCTLFSEIILASTYHCCIPSRPVSLYQAGAWGFVKNEYSLG